MFKLSDDGTTKESLDIHDYVVEHPASTFFLQLDSDGPEGSDLQPGDVLVVDKAADPSVGNLIVASEAGEMVVLYFDPNINQEEITLWGVVVGLVRKF